MDIYDTSHGTTGLNNILIILFYYLLLFSRQFCNPRDSLVAQRVESACNVGGLSSIPGSGQCPGEKNGNPLQYSCLENPMDGGGAWWATVHTAAKSQT